MKRILLAVFALCPVALAQTGPIGPPVDANNYTTVTSSNIVDYSGNKLSSGRICFQGTDANSNPISFQPGGRGQTIVKPVCTTVTNGAIASGFHVANPANTIPAGICYTVTVTDPFNPTPPLINYTCVQPTGATWNLDLYSPTGPATLPLTGGSVNGPLTVNGGPLNVIGNFLLTGSITAPLLSSASLNDGSALARKPAQNDDVIFLSPNGNDSNDGTSWGTAKATCAGVTLAVGSNAALVMESAAVSSDCIASSGSATGVNGFIIAPSRIYFGPLGQATAGTTGFDSRRARFVGSAWDPVNLKPVDDTWEIFVNVFPGAFSFGSNIISSHSSSSNGAGRWLMLHDLVIANPRTATSSLYSNSFAFDNQGAYYDGGAQQMLWEMANTVSCDGCALSSMIFRQNFVPIFSSSAAGAQAEICFGGNGTLQVSGPYSGPPKWCFTNLRGSSFHRVKWEQNVTADRTATVVDADSNTVIPLANPGDSKWVFYIDAGGIQNRTQPACGSLSNAAPSCSTDTTNGGNITSGTVAPARVGAAGSAGYIQFNNTTLGGDSNFFWDNVNKRLGIGTTSPSVQLHLRGGAMGMVLDNPNTGGTTWYIGSTDSSNGAGQGKLVINNSTSTGSSKFTIDSATGNIGINQTSPGSTLDVNGTLNASTSATSPKHCLTANICWTSGAGVPSSASCTASNGGSLYSRTDGTPTTTLYVCDNSTHVWTAK